MLISLRNYIYNQYISIRHKWKYKFDPLYRTVYDSDHARQFKLLLEYEENEILYGKEYADKILENALAR